MNAYDLVIPAPWIHLDLGQPSGAESQLMELVDEAMATLPKEVPPDQSGPLRRRLEHRIGGALREARAHGGIELFLPTESWHGFLNGASFLVARIDPGVGVPADVAPDQYSALVLAELLAQDGASRVRTPNGVWVRVERVNAADTAPDVDVPTVSVDYLSAVPGAPASWLGVMFSTVGDGDPASELTRTSVDLFDAIMSTWRWADDERAATG